MLTEQDFTCHAWLPDERIALGTATGDIILLESLEVHTHSIANTYDNILEKYSSVVAFVLLQLELALIHTCYCALNLLMSNASVRS
jgi:hypothetical protein